MNYTVKVFAGLAERLGTRELKIALREGATAADIRHTMLAQYPAAEADILRALIAINRTYASDSTTISEGDEIGLIPPVGGGSPLQEAGPSCIITENPLSINDAYTQLSNARHGGIVVFCGTVREWTQGRQTDYLTYEAYRDMAIAKMSEIERDVKAEWPEVSTIQWHRIGRLDPTDIAVICGAASPHRDTAFVAARTLIERLKKEVPIWKKEFFADGDHVWKSNP